MLPCVTSCYRKRYLKEKGLKIFFFGNGRRGGGKKPISGNTIF
jgi:hypothetical protein